MCTLPASDMSQTGKNAKQRGPKGHASSHTAGDCQDRPPNALNYPPSSLPPGPASGGPSQPGHHQAQDIVFCVGYAGGLLGM